MVFGHRFEYSDQSFCKILELDSEAVLLAGSAQTQVITDLSPEFNYWAVLTEQTAVLVFYWAESLFHQQLYDAFPGLMKYLPGPHQTVHANYKEIEVFLRKEIERHQEEWNPDDPRDYIDVYLAEMEKVSCYHIFSKASLNSFKMYTVKCNGNCIVP